MDSHDPPPAAAFMVLRLHPGAGTMRTDVVRREASGEETLLHRHQSPPGKFGIEEFRQAVSPLVESGLRRAIIDLVEVRWAPSEVIENLLVIESYLREGGVATVVARPNSRVSSVLTITGLIRLIEVCESLEEAIASLGRDADTASS
jgi:hypothetical protein